MCDKRTQSKYRKDGRSMLGAIFDVDGTLLDSMPIWEDAGEKYLQTIGIVARPELGEILFPMSMEDAAAYMKKEYALSETIEEIVAGVAGVIDDFYRNQVPLKEGAEYLLQELKARGVRMVIATSGDKELVEAAFSRLGVREYFEKIFTCTEVGAGKSKPDIFLKAAEFLKMSPEEIWVFEDALHAIETAKNAGFPVAGIHDKSSERQREEIEKVCDMYLEKLKNFKIME